MRTLHPIRSMSYISNIQQYILQVISYRSYLPKIKRKRNCMTIELKENGLKYIFKQILVITNCHPTTRVLGLYFNYPIVHLIGHLLTIISAKKNKSSTKLYDCLIIRKLPKILIFKLIRVMRTHRTTLQVHGLYLNFPVVHLIGHRLKITSAKNNKNRKLYDC